MCVRVYVFVSVTLNCHQVVTPFLLLRNYWRIICGAFLKFEQNDRKSV